MEKGALVKRRSNIPPITMTGFDSGTFKDIGIVLIDVAIFEMMLL